jgi:hypothetical protein
MKERECKWKGRREREKERRKTSTDVHSSGDCQRCDGGHDLAKLGKKMVLTVFYFPSIERCESVGISDIENHCTRRQHSESKSKRKREGTKKTFRAVTQVIASDVTAGMTWQTFAKKNGIIFLSPL